MALERLSLSMSLLAATLLINPSTVPSLTNQQMFVWFCFLTEHSTKTVWGDMESSACTYPLHDQSSVTLSVIVGGWRKRSVRWPSGLIRRAGGCVACQIADSTAGPKRRSDGQDSSGRMVEMRKKFNSQWLRRIAGEQSAVVSRSVVGLVGFAVGIWRVHGIQRVDRLVVVVIAGRRLLGRGRSRRLLAIASRRCFRLRLWLLGGDSQFI